MTASPNAGMQRFSSPPLSPIAPLKTPQRLVLPVCRFRSMASPSARVCQPVTCTARLKIKAKLGDSSMPYEKATGLILRNR